MNHDDKQAQCKCVYCLDSRIEKLEKILKEVDRFQAITNLQYQHNIKNRKPYKCPVCDGKGKDKDRLVCEPYDQAIKVLVNPDCHACEGTGIVWG